MEKYYPYIIIKYLTIPFLCPTDSSPTSFIINIEEKYWKIAVEQMRLFGDNKGIIWASSRENLSSGKAQTGLLSNWD